jgi:hypothetical protein
MIANIANHDQLSIYFTGDRKSPTSIGLSVAKQHLILDLHGIHSIIKVDKEGIYASTSFKQFLYLMHQTSKTQVDIYKSWEAYNALGLAFQKGGRLVVRALWKVRRLSSFFWLLLRLYFQRNLPFDRLEFH